uniref:Uncharacterized protein n=1 Tax=Anguilla anguilla TaxID=7936 RepID=A0A0E9VUH2_ANGAN
MQKYLPFVTHLNSLVGIKLHKTFQSENEILKQSLYFLPLYTHKIYMYIVKYILKICQSFSVPFLYSLQ